MKYVLLRDDDTNALTSPSAIDQLYRPFLERGLPVNLAVIPCVNLATRRSDGRPEGFLLGRGERTTGNARIGENLDLVKYLKGEKGLCVIQHGYEHSYYELDSNDRAEVVRRLEEGQRELLDAGLRAPRTFVAPYDKLSSVAMREVARRFSVLSTGWFERARLPRSFWPRYVARKALGAQHWRVGDTMLLAHPGTLLSCDRKAADILPAIERAIDAARLTVLVTHWWEYFRDGTPDAAFIRVLHDTAEYLATRRDVQVLAFEALETRSAARELSSRLFF